MSQISRGIFAAIAVSLTLGAAQFALGRDLSGGLQGLMGTPATPINREAKADRASGVVPPNVETRTISLRPSGLSDTSVLVRVPVAQATRNRPSAPSWIKPGDRKAAAACEPVVSILTDVAKQLQPGRCVT